MKTLRELVTEATPGPWSAYDDSLTTGRMEIVARGKTVARIYKSVPAEDWPNAAYIAACSPDAILALLDERDALKADAARGRYMIDNGCWHRGEEQTHLAVLVPQGSDLSCLATRRNAIDAAMGAKP